MSFTEFQESLHGGSVPPADLSLALQALWYDGHGDWERAHACAQEDAGPEGAWVHAYLHRKEGDLGNAGYWYSRAARRIPVTSFTLTAEWEAIARELVGKKPGRAESQGLGAKG